MPASTPPSVQPADISTEDHNTTPSSSIQDLLRFLTQTASIPLPRSLALVKPLHAAKLTDPQALAVAKLATITAALTPLPESDRTKVARQIHNAAKRSIKKRTSGDEPDDDTGGAASAKRRRGTHPLPAVGSSAGFPRLPAPSTDEALMQRTVLLTNRAPLLLAFATVSLAYTSTQPEESRLSLGFSMMSAGARAHGRALGILPPGEKGEAEREKNLGGRKISVLGKEVSVLRRELDVASDHLRRDEKVKQETDQELKSKEFDQEPAYWAINPEATSADAALPIHTPQSAHAYLIKAFASHHPPESKSSSDVASKLPTTTPKQKLDNLSLLLGALHVLFRSWEGQVEPRELGQRGSSWYSRVKPDVGHGREGWGQKGEVALASILSLRRKSASHPAADEKVKVES